MHSLFSKGILLAFKHARDAALSLGVLEIGTGELLVGLIRAGHWFDATPIDADRVVQELAKRVGDPGQPPTELPFSEAAKAAMGHGFRAGARPSVDADLVAVEGMAPLEPLGLVLGLLADRTNRACAVLSGLGIDLDALEQLATRALSDELGS